MRKFRHLFCCLALTGLSFSLAEGSKTVQVFSSQTVNQEKPKDSKDEKTDEKKDKKDKDEQDATEDQQGSDTTAEDKQDKKNDSDETQASDPDEKETGWGKDKKDNGKADNKDSEEKVEGDKKEDKAAKKAEDDPIDEGQADQNAAKEKSNSQNNSEVAAPKKNDTEVTGSPEPIADKQKKEKSNAGAASSAAPGQNKVKIEEAVKAVPGLPKNGALGRSGAAPGQASSPRVYVGEVSVNDGENVFIGGSKLEGSSPWLSVVRQGMWVEAQGHWQDEEFVTEGISVVSPNDWTYFRGPAQALGGKVAAAGYKVVEAWTANGDAAPEGVRALPDEEASVRLVAFFNGTKLVAAPATLPPPPAGLEPGWVELTGYFDGEKVVWEEGTPFP